MSKKASPKLIGAFVLGGIGLLIAGLLVFGSTNFLRERHLLVSYFDGSLKGLRIGAAVTFRGVPIGQVTDIKVLFKPSRTEASIPSSSSSIRAGSSMSASSRILPTRTRWPPSSTVVFAPSWSSTAW